MPLVSRFIVLCLLFLAAGCSSQEPEQKAAAESYDLGDVEVINRILRDNDGGGVLASAGWKIDQPESWQKYSDTGTKPETMVYLVWRKGKLFGINFWNTKLTGTLDLTGLSSVKQISIGVNDLPEIKGLASLSGLELLWVTYNKCRSLGDLSGLTRLHTLGFSVNQLKSVGDLSGLTRLAKLEASYNRELSDIGDLSGLTDLKILDISVCDLESVGDLSGLTKLTNLDVSWNKLKDIGDLSGLTRLTRLNVARNELQSLGNLGKLTRLRSLEAGYNYRLADIGDDLSQLTLLQHLDVNMSDLESFGDLSGLTGLKTLDASYSHLTELSELTAYDHLEKLDVGNNYLTRLPDLTGMKVLRELDVSNNPFDGPDFVKNVPAASLKTFVFSEDQLPVFNLSAPGFENLDELHLKNFSGYRYIGRREFENRKISDFEVLNLAGRPLKVLFLDCRLNSGQVVGPGPLDRLVVGGAGYLMTELVDLHRKIKPAVFDVIGTQHPKLGDSASTLAVGPAYPLKSLSPRLSADYQAAGATARLMIGDKSIKTGGSGDINCGFDFPRVKAEKEAERLSDAYTFNDGQVVFKKSGDYYVVITSDDFSGSGSPAVVIYADVFTVR